MSWSHVVAAGPQACRLAFNLQDARDLETDDVGQELGDIVWGVAAEEVDVVDVRWGRADTVPREVRLTGGSLAGRYRELHHVPSRHPKPGQFGGTGPVRVHNPFVGDAMLVESSLDRFEVVEIIDAQSRT